MPLPIIFLLVVLLLCATLLPLSRHTRWWVRDLDFPRLQIALLALGILLAQLVHERPSDGATWAAAALTAACLLYQAWWIVPYTRIYPNEVRQAASGDPERRIRILTSNVLTPNRNAAGLVALIREHQPDLFVTLETDLWWERQLDVLEADYRYTMKCPLDNLYGMHVYSRLPLEDTETQFLVEDDIPSMHAMVVLPSGHKVRIHFLHPTPPSPTEHADSGARDAELLVVAKSVAGLDTPVIVAGDLNDVAWSETTRLFRKISGLLDPRVGRGMFNTFHANYWFMRWPLDHLFHSRHFTLSQLRRLPNYGSDHFPMLVELSYEHATDQEGLEADADDERLAREKIAAEGASVADVHEPTA